MMRYGKNEWLQKGLSWDISRKNMIFHGKKKHCMRYDGDDNGAIIWITHGFVGR